MFKVSAVEVKESQKNICRICGTEYIPDSFAYAAIDIASPDDTDGEVIGICQFSFTGKCIIHCLAPAMDRESDEAVLILGFSVLEFLRRCGFSEVSANTANIKKEYALRLGFRQTDDKYILDLTAGRACGGH
ncbi:MAG: hypothetical protein E7578_00550 [Ruminococcaceae bacterium]|nr:hypothetical protein [Oscillospiraceae bacterium]